MGTWHLHVSVSWWLAKGNVPRTTQLLLRKPTSLHNCYPGNLELQMLTGTSLTWTSHQSFIFSDFHGVIVFVPMVLNSHGPRNPFKIIKNLLLYYFKDGFHAVCNFTLEHEGRSILVNGLCHFHRCYKAYFMPKLYYTGDELEYIYIYLLKKSNEIDARA